MYRRPVLFVLGLALASACSAPAPDRAAATPPAAAGVPAFDDILKIDVHAHNFEDMPLLNEMLRRTKVRAVNVSVPGTDGHLATMHRIASGLASTHPDIHAFASTFDLRDRYAPGWAEATTKALDETFADGAVMVKIWKEVGIDLKRPDGTFMMPDDTLLDPVYAHLAARGTPLHAHLAEPLDAWRPLDADSVHYSYYSKNPEWHLYGKPGYPSHADIIAARDRILEKHPTLVVIAAHLASLEHDVAEIATRLDRYPNLYVEVAARTRDLTYQPTGTVRDFFLKYQDRILYGVDRTWMPYARETPPTDDERARFVQDLEAQYRLDYAYYASTGTVDYRGREVQALGLPADVLAKFYHRNAQRVIPGLRP
jgi:predicted TIM-barrel fold metal-dependent hydrolase